MLTLILTVLPSILILSYVILSDRFREPTASIITVFFLGYLITLPAGFLNNLIIFQNEELNLIFLAGLTEESLKLLALFLFIKEKKHFNEPMDGIVYGVLISLGFATYENYGYVYYLSYEYGMSPFELATVRSISAIPMHGFCGIIMGYYFGQYIFKGDTSNLAKCWIIPMFIHGMYNFLAGIDFPSAILFLVIAGVYSYLLLHEVIRRQTLKEIEDEKKII